MKEMHVTLCQNMILQLKEIKEQEIASFKETLEQNSLKYGAQVDQ